MNLYFKKRYVKVSHKIIISIIILLLLIWISVKPVTLIQFIMDVISFVMVIIGRWFYTNNKGDTGELRLSFFL